MQMKPDHSINVRRSYVSLVVLELIVFIPVVIWIFAAIRRLIAWEPVIILLASGVLIYVWFKSYSLEVASGVLKYKSLFGGTKQISLDEIVEAKVEIGFSKYSDRFRPTIRIKIQPGESSSMGMFDINIRVFNRKDIEQLLQLLTERKLNAG